ncbi:hypothetical protein OC835_004038 [Tilletia horrida]|nr:hypothetical protein OC835_004038 [Tilletia horrida]
MSAAAAADLPSLADKHGFSADVKEGLATVLPASHSSGSSNVPCTHVRAATNSNIPPQDGNTISPTLGGAKADAEASADGNLPSPDGTDNGADGKTMPVPLGGAEADAEAGADGTDNGADGNTMPVPLGGAEADADTGTDCNLPTPGGADTGAGGRSSPPRSRSVQTRDFSSPSSASTVTSTSTTLVPASSRTLSSGCCRARKVDDKAAPVRTDRTRKRTHRSPSASSDDEQEGAAPTASFGSAGSKDADDRNNKGHNSLAEVKHKTRAVPRQPAVGAVGAAAAATAAAAAAAAGPSRSLAKRAKVSDVSASGGLSASWTAALRIVLQICELAPTRPDNVADYAFLRLLPLEVVEGYKRAGPAVGPAHSWINAIHTVERSH